MKVYCVFSLESPHRGDSDVYTRHAIFIIKKKITPEYSKSAAMGFFFKGTQEQVRNSHGKRAISVRATGVLLYLGIQIEHIPYFHLPFNSYNLNLLISGSKFSGIRKFTLKYRFCRTLV